MWQLFDLEDARGFRARKAKDATQAQLSDFDRLGSRTVAD